MHPSELPSSFEHAAMPPVRAAGSRRFKAAVASSASVLLVTGGLLLAQSTGSPAGASIGPHIATTFSALPASDRDAAHSMLALVIYEGQHLGTATAMVLPPGDLAVTTTPVPSGATVMGGTLGGPSVALKVIGTDSQLGVTVLRLPTTFPVTDIGPLAPAVSTSGAPTSLTALASVRGTTTPNEFAYAAAYLEASPAAATVGQSVISVTHGRSLAGVIAGTLILNGDGRAVAAQVPALGPTSFVSASFLRLLAERIVLGNSSDHGWLQLYFSSSRNGAARVVGVTDHGAAWGKVRPGDRIVAINSVRVRTMADIGSILYTSSPGQPMDLTIHRDGRTITADLVLATSP